MKVAFALILYIIVVLFNLSAVRTKNLLIDFAARQLLVFTPCNFTSDCVHLENSACVANYCECNGSKFCPSQLDKKVLKLGQSCDDTSDCLIESSVCAEGICRCIEGAVESMDRGKCLKDQESKLNTTEKCSDGCQCKTGYVLNDASTACLKIVETLNAACDEDVQCFTKIQNSICHQGSCECIERHRYNANENMCTEDSSSDVASGDETDDHISAECVDGICKQQNAEVQLSNADEACIGSLCDDFNKEQQRNCTVGRCECPEEKQFCTNGDTNKKRERSYMLHQANEQFGRYGAAETDNKRPVENYLYQSIIDHIRVCKYMMISDDKTEILVLIYLHLFNSLFIYWALYTLTFAPPQTKQYFATVILPWFIFFSGLSVLWIFGFRITMFLVLFVVGYITAVRLLYSFIYNRLLVFLLRLVAVLRPWLINLDWLAHLNNFF